MTTPAVTESTCTGHPNGGMCIGCAPWMFPNPPKPQVCFSPHLSIDAEVERWANLHPWHDSVSIRENIAIGIACGSYEHRPYGSRE